MIYYLNFLFAIFLFLFIRPSIKHTKLYNRRNHSNMLIYSLYLSLFFYPSLSLSLSSLLCLCLSLSSPSLFLSLSLSLSLSVSIYLSLSLSLTALLILSLSLSIFLSVFLSGPVSFSITYIFRNFFILILTLTFGLMIWHQMALSLQQVSTYLTTLIT